MEELERYLLAHETDYNFSDSRLLREVAYDRIKDAIRHANIPPGEPLSENRISKVLGISRTPVREALQMLSQEGLVEIIPGRAVTVAARSFRQILDVLYIRSLLEPELTRLATENITPTQLETLWDSLRKMESAVEKADRAGWSIADTAWHDTLSEACPNELLGELVLQLRNRVHQYASIDHNLKIRQLRNGTAEHRLIVEAIASGDSDAAAQAMKDHLESLRKNLFDHLIYN
ncbi:MAG: GntR family transcriptional regulator [Candidatus Promineifilaceae bacterium]|nr:GntR family transcriptional regulator [Candidatus Promineifilaceae bacterium]